MNIAEVERRTGLTRANIRFYEKEGLIAPVRSANGYRDYTEADVETLRKVRLLRQLRLSVADIRAVQAGERPLPEAAAKQLDVLEQDIREGQQAYAACRAICDDRAEWDGLDVDKYLSISVLPSYAVAAPGEQDRIPPAGCPWRRYFARSLDLSLYGLIWSMVALWGFRANPAGQIPLPWAMLCNYAAWALVFVFEPLLLHFWGTTVGKWIFGLSVRDEDGNKLSIRTAFYRTWGVFIHGMGGGIPVYDLYRNIQCWRYCEVEELSWDLDNSCAIVVRERETKWYRAAGYIALTVLAILADVGIVLRAELPPNRGELTLAEYVENCNDYLAYRGLNGRMRPDGSYDPDAADTGGVTVYIIPEVQVVCTAETDENGYVSAVTVRQEINDGMLVAADLDTMRGMLLYAYGLSHERMGVLSLNQPSLSSALAQNAEDFTESLGSLTVTQQVSYEGYERAGDELDAPLWPIEDAPAYHYRMDFRIAEN